MLQGEHSAILSTFIKLPVVIKTMFCLFLSGRFTQLLMYFENSVYPDQLAYKERISFLTAFLSDNVNLKSFMDNLDTIIVSICLQN